MSCRGRKLDINQYKISRIALIEKSAQRNGPRKAIYSPDGSFYKGQWENDLKQGAGTQGTPLYRYVGYWKNNKRHGNGICTMLNEETGHDILYDGEWRNGKPWGFGIRKYTDGGYYRGDWKNGQRQGTGQMWYPNDDYYAGTWSNGQRDGYGIFVYSNGNRYEGQWEDDMKQGKGKLFNFNKGLVLNGLWDKGLFKCGEVRNIAFRQAAINPTAYPIPVVSNFSSIPCCFVNNKIYYWIKISRYTDSNYLELVIRKG
ncbi:hypothetical protein O3M35_010710 [Rhynocoris fuscipes]|uniref:MORN repeat-containing protein 3 n=1 Tax=Rhynocoris fuscipes TaxID=488301 RepID=A0AAW1D344_9HEMI